MDASDSRCRCIGMIIARDLRLVVSSLYRMAITQLQVTCHHYIIPLFRGRPPGLNKLYKRKEVEREGSNIQSCRVRTCKTQQSRYQLVQLNGDLSVDPAHGKLHLQWQVVKTHTNGMCTGPRSPEEKKRREKEETSKTDPVLHISTSELNPHSSDHPFLSPIYRYGGHCRNRLGGRASAHDLASMAASTADVDGSFCRWHES